MSRKHLEDVADKIADDVIEKLEDIEYEEGLPESDEEGKDLIKKVVKEAVKENL